MMQPAPQAPQLYRHILRLARRFPRQEARYVIRKAAHEFRQPLAPDTGTAAERLTIAAVHVDTLEVGGALRQPRSFRHRM